jgi:hypothetical protein
MYLQKSRVEDLVEAPNESLALRTKPIVEMMLGHQMDVSILVLICHLDTGAARNQLDLQESRRYVGVEHEMLLSKTRVSMAHLLLPSHVVIDDGIRQAEFLCITLIRLEEHQVLIELRIQCFQIVEPADNERRQDRSAPSISLQGQLTEPAGRSVLSTPLITVGGKRRE